MRAKKITENIEDFLKPKELDKKNINILKDFLEIYEREDLNSTEKIFKIFLSSVKLPKEDPYDYIHLWLHQWWSGSDSNIALVRVIDKTKEILRNFGYLIESIDSLLKPKGDKEINKILDELTLHQKLALYNKLAYKNKNVPKEYLPSIIIWFNKLDKMDIKGTLDTSVYGIFMKDNGDLSFKIYLPNGWVLEVIQKDNKEEEEIYLRILTLDNEKYKNRQITSFEELNKLIKEFSKK